MAGEILPIELITETDTFYYETFPSALAKANKYPTATIRLKDNIRFDGKAAAQTVKKHLDIDLNGYALGDTLSGTKLLYMTVDTASLHIYSSRPGGKIWATRAYESRIIAIQCTKGQVQIEDITIDVENSSDSLKASATAVSTGSAAKVSLKRCTIIAHGRITTYGLSSYSDVNVEDCRIETKADSTGGYGINILAYDTASHKSAQARIYQTTIRVTALQKAYGISSKASTELVRDTVWVSAEHSSAIGLYTTDSTATYRVRNCAFTSEAGWITAGGVYAYRGRLDAADSEFRGLTRQDTAKVRETDCMARGVNTGAGVNVRLDRCVLTARGTNKSVSKFGYALSVHKQVDSIRLTDCHLISEAAKEASVVQFNSNLVGRVTLTGGYYSDDRYIRMYKAPGQSVYRIDDPQLTNAGYRYAIRPITDPGVVVARMYHTENHNLLRSFNTLSDALEYVQFHEGAYTIVVEASCQLAEGTYYLPDYARMVIAHKEGQNSAIGEKASRATTQNVKTRQEYVRVEIPDNTTLYVEGMLEVSALQQEEGSAAGTVSGSSGYGLIHLAPTAKILLEPGSHMQAWGYVTGSGYIQADNGATVREMVQLGDWKGGTVSLSMLNNPQKVFPITHFFYQNIECPITYLSGSRALGSTVVNTGGYTIGFDEVHLIDQTDALFVMSSQGSSVSKAYDPETDRMEWTTRGEVTLKELSIKTTYALGSGYNLISTNYVLPLGTNTTIRIQTGTLATPHDVVMLPGSIVEVDSTAELAIRDNARLYLYDEADWGQYGSKRVTTVTYSPSWNTCPRDTVPDAARLVVNGIVRVDGALYTTETGADIIGTDAAAGQIIFPHGAADSSMIYQLVGNSQEYHYQASVTGNAALRNSDGSLTHTDDSRPEEIYTYQEGTWKSNRSTPEDPGTGDTPTSIEPNPHTLIERQVILQNGQIYILRNDRIYTVTGQEVK